MHANVISIGQSKRLKVKKIIYSIDGVEIFASQKNLP